MIIYPKPCELLSSQFTLLPAPHSLSSMTIFFPIPSSIASFPPNFPSVSAFSFYLPKRISPFLFLSVSLSIKIKWVKQ